MIKNLHIRRFKSIKELDLDCRRVNLFIGEPNTGKSNILETLGMLSFLRYGEAGDTGNAKQFFRFERLGNLFYDEVLDEPVEVRCDDISLTLAYHDGEFSGVCQDDGYTSGELQGDYGGIQSIERSPVTDSAKGGKLPGIPPFKFYRFRAQESFSRKEAGSLLPPSGENLPYVLMSNGELRSVVGLPFVQQELRLGIRPHEGKMEVIKDYDKGLIISYPFSLASETLQRLTFFMAAIRSNKDSVIVFEEPEAHSFPYHTKYLAEVIALDDSGNQYFIATHNPYFLMPLLEKTPEEDVAVHIVYYEDYQTKTRQLLPDDMEELFEMDVFGNLERFLEAQ